MKQKRSLWQVLLKGLEGLWGFSEGKRKMKSFVFLLVAGLASMKIAPESSTAETFIMYGAYVCIALFVTNAIGDHGALKGIFTKITQGASTGATK